MLVIRLQRTGKKNQPFFRIVLAEKTAPIKGKFIEKLGFLNTVKKEKKINTERVKHWIGKGAQPSDTIYNILVEEKILKDKKRFIKIKKKKEKKKEGKEEENKENTKVEEKVEKNASKEKDKKEEENKGAEKKESKPEVKKENKQKEEQKKEKESSPDKPKAEEKEKNKK
jgi:small subunit ribosomal protein S16